MKSDENIKHPHKHLSVNDNVVKTPTVYCKCLLSQALCCGPPFTRERLISTDRCEG